MAQGMALPIVGLSAGAALMLIGSNQLSAAWTASEEQIPRRNRTQVGVTGAGMILLGTALNAMSAYELERARRARR